MCVFPHPDLRRLPGPGVGSGAAALAAEAAAEAAEAGTEWIMNVNSDRLPKKLAVDCLTPAQYECLVRGLPVFRADHECMKTLAKSSDEPVMPSPRAPRLSDLYARRSTTDVLRGEAGVVLFVKGVGVVGVMLYFLSGRRTTARKLLLLARPRQLPPETEAYLTSACGTDVRVFLTTDDDAHAAMIMACVI